MGDKRIPACVVRWLQDELRTPQHTGDRDQLEVALQCLVDYFQLNEQTISQFAHEPGLNEVFQGELSHSHSHPAPFPVHTTHPTDRPHCSAADDPDIDGLAFQRFLDKLERNGYFRECTPGTPEYGERLDHARTAFKQHKKSESPAASSAAGSVRAQPEPRVIIPVSEEDIAKAEELKNKGNELLRQKRYVEAIELYSAAIHANPNSAIFYANRAAAASAVAKYPQDYDAIIRDCQSSIELNPSYGKAHSRLGLAYYQQQRYSEAVAAYRQAYILDPSDATKENLALAEQQLQQQRGTHAPPPPHMNMNNMAQFMSGLASQPGILNNLMSQAGAAGISPADLQNAFQDPQLMSQMGSLMNNVDLGSLLSAFGGAGAGAGGPQ
eukprot:gnl/Spiro4/28569_TR14127_c0_g1_i1.p1 gnl/Spiro4/28569_TR14127_c0_g1~~gnl/Spiro4/28569_TR14127_c0_g1_i1.p1  ORF type:complete len:382 (-),score=87.76 gnl/Spiro4/28569_TR14127_c0_g1_i1:204-1349(-)